MFKAKILVVGPCKSGKTAISNFLSDATETSVDEYHPTQGCRILEFEMHNISMGSGKNMNAEIELWDCSGDHKFEACWPAIAKDAAGVVFVFNPADANHDKDLDTWFSYFVSQQGLRETQCVVLANNKGTGAATHDEIPLPASMNRVRVVQTSLDDDSESIREEFSRFLAGLLTDASDKREQEELSIINAN